MKIVCVDDDAISLKYLQESIKRMELPAVDLVMCECGMKAIEAAGASPVDLMILDSKLPDIGGLDVLRKVKAMRPATEVLMVTGHSSVELAVEAIKAGARDYIEKPVRFALLREKVRNIVELQMREREAEDYRFAKELMEDGARREVSSLEEAICAMRECQARVLSIIRSDRKDGEKVAMILAEISGDVKDTV
jgi:DNA-binding NtrC family response regulator